MNWPNIPSAVGILVVIILILVLLLLLGYHVSIN